MNPNRYLTGFYFRDEAKRQQDTDRREWNFALFIVGTFVGFLWASGWVR